MENDGAKSGAPGAAAPVVRRAWTPEQATRLRELAGQSPLQDVARQMGRSYLSVKNAVHTFGVDCGRAWTTEQLERLRVEYRRVPARQLALALGRPLSGLYRMALKLGLGRKAPRFTEEDFARIKALNAEGWPDTEIARELGRDRHETTRHRQRLGLPSRQRGEHWRARLAAGLRRQLDRLGVRNPGELRKQAYRSFARGYGLPEDLPPRAVLIVLALLRQGVLMRREIYEAVGSPWRGGRGALLCNATKTSYLGALQRRGLVARIHRRSEGPGARRLPDLYLLTPAALDLLAAAAARQQGEPQDARDE